MIHDRARLEATLGHKDLAWLVNRLRARVESGRSLTGTASLASPTTAQREAIDRLLGRPPSSDRRLRVTLRTLNKRLREAGICDSLEDAARAFGAPLVDRQAALERVAHGWEEMSQRVAKYANLHPWINLHQWWKQLRTEGLLNRLTDGEPEQLRGLLNSTLRVLSELPVEGIVLPELAAETLGDSHALDSGQPVGTLVLRALACMTGPPASPQGTADETHNSLRLDVHGPAAVRHELWARVGVDVDALAGSVLVLNLPANSQGLTGSSLTRHTAAGEPLRLTGRQLQTHPPDLAPVWGRPVYICENPAVVAAAAHRLGPRCAPILCTEGQPRLPLHLLVSRIVAAGGRLLVRADFDWSGVGIVAGLLAPYGNSAEPWRMDRAEYLDHLTPGAGPPLRPDRRRETPWDPLLMSAMVERGVAVHEESLLPRLLRDLDLSSLRNEGPFRERRT